MENVYKIKIKLENIWIDLIMGIYAPYNNLAIHHAKGCVCCHECINHLLGAQSLGQINLQCIDVKNTVQSAWPTFINSIEIDADQCIQGQLSDLHAQIDELNNSLHDAKKSYCNTEAVLTKEHSRVKDLEQAQGTEELFASRSE